MEKSVELLSTLLKTDADQVSEFVVPKLGHGVDHRLPRPIQFFADRCPFIVVGPFDDGQGMSLDGAFYAEGTGQPQHFTPDSFDFFPIFRLDRDEAL